MTFNVTSEIYCLIILLTYFKWFEKSFRNIQGLKYRTVYKVLNN